MARRINCSTFTPKDYALSFNRHAKGTILPTPPAKITMPEGWERDIEGDKAYWDHNDMVLLANENDKTDPIVIGFGGEFEASKKAGLNNKDKHGRTFMHDLWSLGSRDYCRRTFTTTRQKDGRWAAIDKGMTTEEADRIFKCGHSYRTQKDNIKTITGKRRELVRRLRHEARTIRKVISDSLNAMDTAWDNPVEYPPAPEPTDFWGIGITDHFECVKDFKI